MDLEACAGGVSRSRALAQARLGGESACVARRLAHENNRAETIPSRARRRDTPPAHASPLTQWFPLAHGAPLTFATSAEHTPVAGSHVPGE